jgi:carboxypeptidase Taq
MTTVTPAPTDPRLAELKTRLAEIDDLRSAVQVLDWDQATYMPSGGADARGRQLATLQRLAHERLIDPALGRLLDGLAAPLPPDGDDAALVVVARRDHARATRVPTEFAARFSRHTSASYQAWIRAREADDFAIARPYLETTVALSRELAAFHPGHAHPADALIDASDEGLDVATVRALFAALRPRLVALAEAIAARPALDDACLRQAYPEDAQLAFGLEVARRLGYDLARGRQDKTHHPFMTRFSAGDVRITTRVRPDDLGEALFSTIHETGHALYEQGIDAAYEATPLATGASSGVHESQSRLWENLVARGRPFWRHFYPRLQAAFPAQLGGVPLEAFYRAINRVQRGPVRTDADEVTYDLHVMIRFDLELALLEGALTVADLPDAWRERYRRDLGCAPERDRDGVLQDVHWYAGPVGGAFQGYTVGNVLASQLYAAARRAHPALEDDLARGGFDALRAWLRANVHRHGRKYLPDELIERATGAPLGVEPYIAYLERKFGELYGL